MDFKAAVLHQPGEELAIKSGQLLCLCATEVVIDAMTSGLYHTQILRSLILNSIGPCLLFCDTEAREKLLRSVLKLVSKVDRVVFSWTPACESCFFAHRANSIYFNN